MSHYLVTGGAGFIGSNIVDRLLTEGHQVSVLDNFATGYRHNLKHVAKDIHIHEVDIRDGEGVRKAMAGVEFVYHQAALPSVPRSIADPMESHEVNVTGTLNVLMAARDAGVQRVVYAASSSAYGDVEEEYKDESMRPRVISPYAAAKLAAENYCLVFNHVYDLEAVVIRYFNVFGPRQDPTSAYAAVIPLFATAMLDDMRPTIYGDGTQSRDFTFIENVVTGNRLAMQSDAAPGEVFNIACGDRITLLDLVDDLNSLLGKDIQPHLADPRPGDILHSRAAIQKARRLLGYEPVVSFKEGLARTLDWYTNMEPHDGQ
jgi:nucleoside-diphosphate-sugar epimerase